MHDHHGHSAGCCSHAEAADTAKDPVCGMRVDPEKTPHHADFECVTYHFCSAECRAKFVADPARYLSSSSTPVPVTSASGVWTCPMHPEIRREGPGTCPICGMALEPAEPSAEDGPNPELVDFTRRLWVSGMPRRCRRSMALTRW